MKYQIYEVCAIDDELPNDPLLQSRETPNNPLMQHGETIEADNAEDAIYRCLDRHRFDIEWERIPDDEVSVTGAIVLPEGAKVEFYFLTPLLNGEPIDDPRPAAIITEPDEEE